MHFKIKVIQEEMQKIINKYLIIFIVFNRICFNTYSQNNDLKSMLIIENKTDTLMKIPELFRSAYKSNKNKDTLIFYCKLLPDSEIFENAQYRDVKGPIININYRNIYPKGKELFLFNFDKKKHSNVKILKFSFEHLNLFFRRKWFRHKTYQLYSIIPY